MFLRDVVIPWMQDNPESVYFNVSIEHTSCGTHGCLAGWYTIMRYPDRVLLEADVDNDISASDTITEDFELEWQTGWDLYHPLFGTDDAGTLEERAERLDKMIAEELANA